MKNCLTTVINNKNQQQSSLPPKTPTLQVLWNGYVKKFFK